MTAGPSTATGPTIGLLNKVFADVHESIPVYIARNWAGNGTNLCAVVDAAPLPGGNLTPPPTNPPAAIDADPLPDAPTEAECAALRALHIDARYALCACRGPGWTVYASGVAVPRLRACAPGLIGVAVDGWLPAGLCETVDLIANSAGIGRRQAMTWIAAEVKDDVPLRVTALDILARVWR